LDSGERRKGTMDDTEVIESRAAEQPELGKLAAGDRAARFAAFRDRGAGHPGRRARLPRLEADRWAGADRRRGDGRLGPHRPPLPLRSSWRSPPGSCPWAGAGAPLLGPTVDGRVAPCLLSVGERQEELRGRGRTVEAPAGRRRGAGQRQPSDQPRGEVDVRAARMPSATVANAGDSASTVTKRQLAQSGCSAARDSMTSVSSMVPSVAPRNPTLLLLIPRVGEFHSEARRALAWTGSIARDGRPHWKQKPLRNPRHRRAPTTHAEGGSEVPRVRPWALLRPRSPGSSGQEGQLEPDDLGLGRNAHRRAPSARARGDVEPGPTALFPGPSSARRGPG